MGIAVPLMLFFLLDLTRISQFFTIFAVTFLAWGMADLLASILEKPRLRNRSARQALQEDWDRRSSD